MAERKSAPAPLQRFTLGNGSRSLTVDQNGTDCVVALRALGEPTRLRIVELLLQSPLEVGEIAQLLGVTQYNVSKHLRILREAGLLDLGKDGRIHRYALPDAIRHQAEAGGVLDLGCCRFQFDRPQPSAPRRRRTASV